MGLAVLPARLKGEMELLKDYILTGKDIRSNEQIAKHADWVDEFLPNYTSITEENVEEILQQEVGKVFCEVLEDAGVYKCNEKGLEAFHRFIGMYCNLLNLDSLSLNISTVLIKTDARPAIAIAIGAPARFTSSL